VCDLDQSQGLGGVRRVPIRAEREGLGMTPNRLSSPRHILVINDTVAILELFTALLEDAGYRSRWIAPRARSR